MISSIVSSSLKTGITTESSGSAGTRAAARCSRENGALMRRATRARPTANSDRPIGGGDQAIERQRPRRDELLEQPDLSRRVLGGAG